MRRRIYIQLMAVSGVAIFAPLFLVTAVYYEVFERQVFEDLKTAISRVISPTESSSAALSCVLRRNKAFTREISSSTPKGFVI